MIDGKLLVVGAASPGIGATIADYARDSWEHVVKADKVFTGTTDALELPCYGIDVAEPSSVLKFFRTHGPFHSVVYCAGVNHETPVGKPSSYRQMAEMLAVNYMGAWITAHAWQVQAKELTEGPPQHFVVVSSNSAHVARSKSSAYCASKAAVSMMVRCVGREIADTASTIWAIEPGWVEGTKMAMKVETRVRKQSGLHNHGVALPLHRIPGNRTLTPADVAHTVLVNICRQNLHLNGCTIRLDGGEQ